MGPDEPRGRSSLPKGASWRGPASPLCRGGVGKFKPRASCHFQSAAPRKSHEALKKTRPSTAATFDVAMEPRRSERIKVSKEDGFGVLLGALIREVPDLFDAEVLSKLDVEDHLRLAQVNKECLDAVYKLSPVEFMSTCPISRPYPKDSCPYDHNLWLYDSYIETGHLVPTWLGIPPTTSGHEVQGDTRAFLNRQHQAAAMGRLDVLKWLWNHGHKCVHYETAYWAVKYGHMHVLEWFFELPIERQLRKDDEDRLDPNCLFGDPEILCMGAAQVGNYEVLKFLREKGCPWGKRTSTEACRYGRLEVMKWLQKEGCLCDLDGFLSVCGGHLDVLKWIRETYPGCAFDARASQWSSIHNRLDCLMWLREHGCPWEASVMNHAAGGKGNLEILKWAHENGCPWNVSTANCAAISGNLEIIRYLHENGCPFSEDACRHAVEGEHWHCLDYLVNNELPGWEEYNY